MHVHVAGSSYDGFPMFRLNSDMVKYWLIGGPLRRRLADTISKTYKTGVVVLNPALYAIGLVDPAGRCTDLSPPFRQYEMWQICNMPSVRYSECACRNFYDPEVGGAWGDRDEARGRDQHHPHCQFVRVAMDGWKRDRRAAVGRMKEGLGPQARPDEWVRTRKALEG